MSIIYCDTYKNPPELLRDASVVFGVFDGVHDGHRYEIDEAQSNKPVVAVTFNIDPDEIFVPNYKKLMTNEERITTLDDLCDYVVVLDFDEVRDVAANDFLDDFFGSNTPAHIHVGENFNFGANKSGDTDVLKKWGEAHDMLVHVHKLLEKDGVPISSTLMRARLV